MQRVQTIYAGASARHIGAAVREGAGALLLERTVHVAPEYIESFRPCPDEPAGGALSGGIRRALEQDGFIQNGCLHAQAAEHLLMAALADSGAQALFCTEILSATPQEGGVLVTALCLDTVREFFCERFVAAAQPPCRCYHALIAPLDGFQPPEGAHVFPTIDPALRILRIPAGPEEPLAQLRQRVRAAKGARLVHLPSICCAYGEEEPGLLGALDAGEKEG